MRKLMEFLLFNEVLKMRISDIRVNRIRVNQGLGVCLKNMYNLIFGKKAELFSRGVPIVFCRSRVILFLTLSQFDSLKTLIPSTSELQQKNLVKMHHFPHFLPVSLPTTSGDTLILQGDQ